MIDSPSFNFVVSFVDGVLEMVGVRRTDMVFAQSVYDRLVFFKAIEETLNEAPPDHFETLYCLCINWMTLSLRQQSPSLSLTIHHLTEKIPSRLLSQMKEYLRWRLCKHSRSLDKKITDDAFQVTNELLFLGQNNPKVPRILEISGFLSTDQLKGLLTEKDRHCDLLNFQHFVEEQPSTPVVMTFLHRTIIDIKGALKLYMRHVKDSTTDNQWFYICRIDNQVFVSMTETHKSNLQCHMICEWATESSAIRKGTFYLNRFIRLRLAHSNHTQYAILLRMLLRWVTVSRLNGKGLAYPHDHEFQLYTCLPMILHRLEYDLLAELNDSFSLALSINKKKTRRWTCIEQERPCFLRSLKSILQLKAPHSIDLGSLIELYNWFQSNDDDTDDQVDKTALFPHVSRSIIELYALHGEHNNNMSQMIELKDAYAFCSGEVIPVFVLLYGMLISRHVPLRIRRLIFTRVCAHSGGVIFPCSVKGKDSLFKTSAQRAMIYKHIDSEGPAASDELSIQEPRAKEKTRHLYTTPEVFEEFVFLFEIFEKLSFIPLDGKVFERHLFVQSLIKSRDHQSLSVNRCKPDKQTMQVEHKDKTTTQHLNQLPVLLHRKKNTREVITVGNVWVIRWPEYSLKTLSDFVLDTIVHPFCGQWEISQASLAKWQQKTP